LRIIKKTIKELFKKLGFDLTRYNPASSQNARILEFFSIYKIDTVLDIGANIGQFAMGLRESGYKGHIISFEPLSKAYSHLLINSKNDPNWIIATRMAIGNEKGKKTINVSGNFVSRSILKMTNTHIKGAPKSAYIGSEEIYIDKLDNVVGNYLGNGENVFIKIDVQGYESQVLKGATDILSKTKGIQIELSLVPLYENQLLFIDILNYITNLGFELYDILPGFRDKQSGKLLQFDGIFFRSF
jgi:FkbM family methyltransferase